MVKVICQHSGIEFEASSGRSKNHPLVSELKIRANKDGNYGEVCKALGVVAKSGGYTTIEEYVSRVKAHIGAKQQQIAERQNAAAAAAKAEVERQAAFKQWLVDNNYVTTTEEYWESVENPNPRDAMDEFIDRLCVRQIITAPDGQKIDRFDAIQIFDSQLTLAEYRQRQAEETAAAAAKTARIAKAKENRAKVHADSVAAFDAKVEEIRSTSTKIVNLRDFPSTAETVANVVTDGGYHRWRDSIKRASVNGKMVYQIVQDTGYDDDGHYSYYEENEPMTNEPMTNDQAGWLSWGRSNV